VEKLALTASTHLLILPLGLTLIALSLVSMWKENRFGWPLRGIISFAVAIIGSCAIIAGYVEKACSLEKVTHHVESVTVD
jgi:hypothetical protein